MSLIIKKTWYSKLIPLEEDTRKQILNDIMVYYFTDIPGDFNHNVKDFIISDIDSRKKPAEKPLWREDYKVYEKSLKDAVKALLSNMEWMKNQRKFHPNLDIEASINKSVSGFWATDRGWNHKKKSRTNNLDWGSTLSNALNMRMNHVYLPRGVQNDTEAMYVWEFDGIRRKTYKKAYYEDLKAYGSGRVKFIREEMA